MNVPVVPVYECRGVSCGSPESPVVSVWGWQVVWFQRFVLEGVLSHQWYVWLAVESPGPASGCLAA